ncbi:MAG TPA: alpha-2-macroglobulin family protein, partial [Polyangiaceae bacterium]
GQAPTVSVPITDDLRPNAFVSVHLLRSMGGESPTPGARGGKKGKEKGKGTGPYYRVGYAALSIDAEARRLTLDVKPRKRELSPGEEVTIDLVARGKTGKVAPTELTVYAVDEGVLMLTGYKTPDPIPIFTAPRSLQVATLETRESMAKISLDAFEGALGSEKGADGGGGGEGSARHDFRQTAYFNPSVMTDESGRASVTFKLPESLTTFRVMAVATTEGDQYGFGQASVVTSRRLMARPNLPRFLRAGDRVEAGIVVSSKGLPKSTVTVRASVQGVLLDGPAEKSIELGKDESVEVRFPLRADTTGDASLRFDVKAGTEHDAVLVTRRIAAPGTLETVALYGSTEKTSAEALGDYRAIRHDTGGLTVTLAPSALVGLDGSAAQLVEYPYACTEQLSSRLLPLLPLRDLATAFGFALPPDVNGVVGRTIAEILSRQRGDGGFGMWPESNESMPWISAYATWVLDQAASHGARISKKARDRAHDYLRRYLGMTDGGEVTHLATAAFMVDVLADAGLPDPGYMARLFESRKQLPTFGRGFLLHALAVGKGPPATVKELAGELSSELRIANDSAFAAENVGDEYAVLLDSEARTGAIVLRGLLAADPKHALGSQLARGLVSQRSHGTWRSTQETAFALVALDAYRRAQESTPPRFTAKVWLGDRTIRTASFTGKLTADRSFVELAKLPETATSALVFEKDGAGKLFYETRLTYVRATLPAAPLDAGFFVQKALRAVDPATLSAALGTIADAGVTRFAAGNLVLADLVVVTPSPRDYVVLDDPLPAGLEAVDATLATTAAWLDVPGSSSTESERNGCDDCESSRDAQAHDRAFLESWYRREVRDDRVLFFVDHMAAGMYHYRYLARATSIGNFVVPPTKAEEMYTPETFGRTGAEMVVVQ